MAAIPEPTEQATRTIPLSVGDCGDDDVMPSDALAAAVLGEWGLVATATTRPESGTTNDIWLVDTSSGPFVLRGHRRRDPRHVDFEHAVMAHARARGIPVPQLVEARTGATVIEREGRLYSLAELAPGVQVPREDLDEGHAAALGVMLGAVHTALQDFDQRDARPSKTKTPSDASVARRIAEILEVIEALADPGEHEAWAVERLRSRAEWLSGTADIPTFDAAVETQLVHGDYQDSLPGSVVLLAGDREGVVSVR